jgi:hypothetical protein
MYDTGFVEAICRGFGQEQKNSRRAKILLDLLQAVVLEDTDEIRHQLTVIIQSDNRLGMQKAN